MARFEKRSETLAKLARIPKQVRPAIRKAVEDSAAEVVAFQKRQVSVKRGRLRDSIKYTMGATKIERGVISIGGKNRTVSGDPDLTAVITAGGREAFYARWVEFGTAPHSLAKRANIKSGKGQNEGRMHPGTPARPFFYGPFRASLKRIKSRVSRAVNKAAKQVAQSG